MNKCIKCDVDLGKQRAHLGYTECLDCSEVEAYSAHTVYPHKTGGYVQPVSKEKSKHLKRIDRRSTGTTRAAKGIYADNSWDRWLEQYYHNLYNPKPKKTYVPTPTFRLSSTRKKMTPSGLKVTQRDNKRSHKCFILPWFVYGVTSLCSYYYSV